MDSLFLRFAFVVELLFEALIGQKTQIRCSHWSKAGQTQTRTEGTGDPYLRYNNIEIRHHEF